MSTTPMTWEGFGGAGAWFMLVAVVLRHFSAGIPEYHVSVFAIGGLMMATGGAVEFIHGRKSLEPD